MNTFRTLTAGDVEVRVGNTKKDKAGNITGFSLLLYKNARVDMAILDEAVGPENWQRTHNAEFCSVAILTPNGWVWKTDAGACGGDGEMAIKGAASDAFKRACFAWGIGRELYTAPFVWVNGSDIYARYEVSDMVVSEERVITRLTIINAKTKEVVFSFGGAAIKPLRKQKTLLDQARELATADEILALYQKHQVEIDADAELKKAIVALGKDKRATEKAAA